MNPIPRPLTSRTLRVLVLTALLVPGQILAGTNDTNRKTEDAMGGRNYTCQLRIGETGEGRRIEAWCRAANPGDVSYRLTTTREGAAGRVLSSQAGLHTFTAEQEQLLAAIAIGPMDQAGRLSSLLLVYENTTLVAEERYEEENERLHARESTNFSPSR